jgi:hypothetical protein
MSFYELPFKAELRLHFLLPTFAELSFAHGRTLAVCSLLAWLM